MYVTLSHGSKIKCGCVEREEERENDEENRAKCSQWIWIKGIWMFFIPFLPTFLQLEIISKH